MSDSATPEQDPKAGLHLTLPDEIGKLERAVEFFKAENDQARLSTLVPQLAWHRAHLPHALRAAQFVESLGIFGHKVVMATDEKPGEYTFNDAVKVVAKVLHEHDDHESGRAVVPPLYVRAGHARLRGMNGGKHCDEGKLKAPRDSAAEVVEHLGLTKPEHVSAAKALFAGKVE